MAYIGHDKLWRSEFCCNASTKDRVQDNKLNQLKLKVNDTYEKDEKLTTHIEISNNEDVLNKTYLDTKLSKKRMIYHIWRRKIMKLNCVTRKNLRTF